jgi:hypothetical protein
MTLTTFTACGGGDKEQSSGSEPVTISFATTEYVENLIKGDRRSDCRFKAENPRQ